MNVWIVKDDVKFPYFGSNRLVAQCDVVIHNGKILKNRYGEQGVQIGGSVYIWEEEIK